MSEAIKIAFEQRIQVLPLSVLLPLRAVAPELKESVKYKRIMRSIAEVGIIEPLVVARSEDQKGRYLLLDGHQADMMKSDQPKKMTGMTSSSWRGWNGRWIRCSKI